MDIAEAKKVTYPNLRAEMARNGDTLETLGEILDMSAPSLNRRLSGQVEWGISEINMICERYKCSFEYLFKRE